MCSLRAAKNTFGHQNRVKNVAIPLSKSARGYQKLASPHPH